MEARPPELFQLGHSGRVLDKQFAPAEGVLGGRDGQVAEETGNALDGHSAPVGPCDGREHFVALEEGGVGLPEDVAVPLHLGRLHHGHVAELKLDEGRVKEMRPLEGVRPDAADVVRILGAQAPHQAAHRHFELSGHGGGPPEIRPSRIAFRKEVPNDGVTALEHGLRQASIQRVAILLQEAGHAVRHASGVVAEPEAICRSRRRRHLDVNRLGAHLGDPLDECLVRSGPLAFVVEDGQENLFDKFADGQVVGERNGGPFESLLDVFLLLLFERRFQDHLLDLFVTIIDDELFQSVGGQVLEAVNVQKAQNAPLAMLLHLKKTKTEMK